MKKFVLPVFAILLIIVIGIIIAKSFLLSKKNAGLQVNSIPRATVYLDGKEFGKTPFEDTRLSAGEKTLKLMLSADSENIPSWEAKIKLNSGTLTLVNRKFGVDERTSAGEVITLASDTNKKSASLAIISYPDAALVKIDGETKDFTPVLIGELTVGEHDVLITSPDYEDRTIRTKFFGGFKTTINVKLASLLREGDNSASTSATPTPAKATSTPSLVNTKVTPTKPAKPYVKILSTPTNWLRVRMEPSTSATESAKVNPGEEYPLLDQKTGWYKISYGFDKEGWISSQYAQKYE